MGCYLIWSKIVAIVVNFISRVSVLIRAIRGWYIPCDLLKIQRPNGSGGNSLRSTQDNKILLDFTSAASRIFISPCPSGQRSKLSQLFPLSAQGSSYLTCVRTIASRTIWAQVVAIVVNYISCDLLNSATVIGVPENFQFLGRGEMAANQTRVRVSSCKPISTRSGCNHLRSTLYIRFFRFLERSE